MSKYIDADKLIAEIERKKAPFKKDIEDNVYPTYLCALMDFEDLIDSLQQEQDLIIINKKDWKAQEQFQKNKDFGKPLQQEQPEVDLEKEIEAYFKGWYMDETDQGYILHTPDDYAGLMSVKQIARHFYELGLKARKKE